MSDLDAIRERDHGWHFSGEDRFSAHDYMQAGLDRRHLLARVAELEAALDAPDDVLDVAWRQVEAVVPQGWRLEQLVWVRTVRRWRAIAGVVGHYVNADGETPAAALIALRALLARPEPKP